MWAVKSHTHILFERRTPGGYCGTSRICHVLGWNKAREKLLRRNLARVALRSSLLKLDFSDPQKQEVTREELRHLAKRNIVLPLGPWQSLFFEHMTLARSASLSSTRLYIRRGIVILIIPSNILRELMLHVSRFVVSCASHACIIYIILGMVKLLLLFLYIIHR